MSGGEKTFGSSIPDGPAGDALRAEAATFSSWTAMHGDGASGADGAATEVDAPGADSRPAVPGFEVKHTGTGAPVPVRQLGFEMVRFATAGAES